MPYGWWFITTVVTLSLHHCPVVVLIHCLGGHKSPWCLYTTTANFVVVVNIHHNGYYCMVVYDGVGE